MRYGIDIFSGAGGLSLGAEMAGIKISYAIEIDASAAQSFLRNHKGAKVLQGDIKELDPKELHTNEKPIFVIMGRTALSRILTFQYKDTQHGQS